MSITLEQFLRRRPATSKEIQAFTGMSQGAVSRRIRRLGEQIIRLKIGRSPMYMMTCNAFGGDDKHPLCMVDAHGNNTAIAYIRPLAHGGFFVQALPCMPSVFLGLSQNGLFNDLPYFLFDLAPQGFIGRQIASEISGHSEFPDDPKLWNVSHIGTYLVSNGDDLPGNLKFGHQAHLRVRRKPNPTTTDEYPDLAERAMSGAVPGSSAGGEQPKFTAYCKERSAHVIVKFSPKGTDAVARRWRDILISEYHATEAIHQTSFPAAETRLIDKGDRLFLESLRFDRAGEYGRHSMISLQYVDAEFTGEGQGWHQAMASLFEGNLVSRDHFHDAVVLWMFGRLINNTDMHLGNLSLSIDGDMFRILPVYDMCSMGFAPKSGEVQKYKFTCPNLEPLKIFGQEISPPWDMARDFWHRVSRDERISDEFKEFLAKGNPIDLMARDSKKNLFSIAR
jgi:hypothetical protein